LSSQDGAGAKDGDWSTKSIATVALRNSSRRDGIVDKRIVREKRDDGLEFGEDGLKEFCNVQVIANRG
jgi:hypothetical protein